MLFRSKTAIQIEFPMQRLEIKFKNLSFCTLLSKKLQIISVMTTKLSNYNKAQH